MTAELPEEKSARRRRTEEAMEVAASLVPFAGGVLSLKYAHAFRQADERRAAVWQGQVTETLNALETRVDGLSVDALFENDQFVDALATATRIAEKAASKIKRAALQNALFNIGAGTTLDVDKRTIYLRYVDELTPSHMTLLRFLDGPVEYLAHHAVAWPNVMMGGLMSVVEVAFPGWAADEPFLSTLAGDLESRGLVDSPGFKTVMTGDGLKAQRTKAKGREFMEFVSGPFDAKSEGRDD